MKKDFNQSKITLPKVGILLEKTNTLSFFDSHFSKIFINTTILQLSEITSRSLKNL
jgi:hypothetical protein